MPELTPSSAPRACTQCKTLLTSDAHFCHHCGMPMDGTWSDGSGQANFIQGLLTLVRGLNSTMDVDALLKRIGQSTEQMFACEASSIMLLDNEKTHLFFKVATGEKGSAITRYKIKLGEGIAGWVASKREAVLVNDASKDPRFTGQTDKASGFKTQSILCVPMLAGGDLVGIIELLNKKSPAGFAETDKNLLESMANVAGLAISNARVLGGFRNFYSNTIEILIAAIESRDPRMAGHCWRVAQRASSLGRKLGLEGDALKDLYYAALLHDIGFLKVAGGWNSSRVLIMESPHQEQTHPLIGVEMIRGIEILRGASELISFHHEAYDGTGFPKGLKGDEIPLSGHILSVIEACEEMAMNGYAYEQILASLQDQAGKKYHPKVAVAYRDVLIQETAKAA